MMGNSQQKQKETLEYPQRQNEEEENPSSFTCEICIEPMPANNKFKNNNLCTNPFCQDCIAKYIEAKIQDDNRTKIECPGLDCQQILDPISSKPLIPENLFVKWCDILCDNYVLGFERSYCPDRNCTALVVNECGKVKKAQCPDCKQWFCFQCKSAWHAGYRCEEAKYLRDPNDISFGQLVEEMTWARCPGCNHCVERKNGCRIIHCRCNTRFCYLCEGKYPQECVCNRSCNCCCFVFSMLIFIIILSVGTIFAHCYDS